jgi:uncharacterized membrane protein YedE/YeeE
MRIFGAAILAASLLVTNAFAATLPSGKPAGVKKAQMEGNTLLIIAGVGLAGLGIGLAASAGNAGGPTTSTSASTSTSSTGTTG